ncbi:hypothetical protein ACIBL6_16950 [Streptomyces sp. NPDC050400]|uniref:hypothetical protein n=1 Tax=Streptomyces sp. NPDC050400 TaxID=3365610 RepID=UPI0037A7895A
MAWVVGAGALLGILAIASGIVTLRTGWVLPTARGHVARPQLHGIGTLFIGSNLVLQSLAHFGALPDVSWEVRFFGGNALLFGGFLLIALSQLLPLRRGRGRVDPSGS